MLMKSKLGKAKVKVAYNMVCFVSYVNKLR